MKLKLHILQGQAGLVHRWGFGGQFGPFFISMAIDAPTRISCIPLDWWFYQFYSEVLNISRLEPHKKQCEFIIKICQLQFQLLQ